MGTPMTPRTKAFLTGASSVFDVKGATTYRRMHKLTPSAPRRGFLQAGRETTQTFRNNFKSL